jgi:hypothetical protein
MSSSVVFQQLMLTRIVAGPRHVVGPHTRAATRRGYGRELNGLDSPSDRAIHPRVQAHNPASDLLSPLPVGLGGGPVNCNQMLVLRRIADARAGHPLMSLGGAIMCDCGPAESLLDKLPRTDNGPLPVGLPCTLDPLHRLRCRIAGGRLRPGLPEFCESSVNVGKPLAT